MGCVVEPVRFPLVECGPVPEIPFTDIEVEVLAGRLARFMLFIEQRPLDCWPNNGPPENVLKVRVVTPIEFVPRFIRKTVFVLGREWGREALAGLDLPH